MIYNIIYFTNYKYKTHLIHVIINYFVSNTAIREVHGIIMKFE